VNPASPAGAATAPETGTAAETAAGTETTRAAVARVRSGATRRYRLVVALLAVGILAVFALSLMAGRTFYAPADVLQVILGEDVPGASFAVGRLRLPRAVLAVLTGACFGLAGVAFQTMLRNPLASPDIIGISSGAGAGAAFAIVGLGLGGAAVSTFAIVSGLIVALAVYALSYKRGVADTRLILVGIGIAAMLDSVTAYVLNQAPEWELQEAMRWLTGSLNGASWNQVLPVLAAMIVLTPVLLAQSKNLAVTRLGDDAASALGVRVNLTRIVVIVTAVGLISFATAAAGPIAFVAFLSGPIAARLVGPGPSLLIPAGLVGALLVLVADFCGQYAFGTRMPVGIITGVLGAPFLVYLIVRVNRAGASL
jgi:iron complex transport system permease protein